MSALIAFWWAHHRELGVLVGQHVLLVAISTVVAAAVGIPLGIFSARRPGLAAPIVGVANVVQTVPSLAMFGFLLPVPLVGGVGARAALVVLILYGLLPIIRTTLAGLRSIDPAVREAAVALGMTPRDLLWRIELPLALPSIVAGVRVAAVIAVGAATIAAAIGAGGLGEYIYRGLSMVNTTVILAGAIPAALLALAVDGGLLWAERRLSTRRRSARRIGPIAALAVVGLLLVGEGLVASGGAGDVIVVGSKNFTEQLILGELVAQTIERDAGLRVDRRLNLGGTFVCDRALVSADIDVYVEYTGTALTAIFHEPAPGGSAAVFDRVQNLYAESGRTLLPPLGFNNTFAVLVRGSDARSRGLRSIDDLARVAPQMRAGFGYEFLDRPDGFRGLARTYGLEFSGPPHAMDLSLTYRALASRQVDVIAGDATAGLIRALDLVQLDDSRHYFPAYDAAPVARSAALLRFPQVRTALAALRGTISADDMRAMNYAADAEHRDIASVVRSFLSKHQHSGS